MVTRAERVASAAMMRSMMMRRGRKKVIHPYEHGTGQRDLSPKPTTNTPRQVTTLPTTWHATLTTNIAKTPKSREGRQPP